METKEKKWCVYIHTNKINNKAYIGITSIKTRERWGKQGNGYKTSSYFYRAIQKYGWDNFEHIIWADGLTEENAKKIEILLIALFDTTNKNKGYNLSSGGESNSGVKMSEETRKKMSKAAKERCTKEWRENISRFNTGEKHPQYGKPRSDETKEKISKALKGKFAGEKHPCYGKPCSKQTKDKLSKPVFCIETRYIYTSSVEASKQTGIDRREITKCCRGKAKSAGKHPITGEKLHWLYVYDQIIDNENIIQGAISLGYIIK